MNGFLDSLSSEPRPASWRDHFSLDYVEWVFRGKPSDVELYNRSLDYERELLERGVFQRREFILLHRQPCDTTAREIGALLTKLGSFELRGCCPQRVTPLLR